MKRAGFLLVLGLTLVARPASAAPPPVSNPPPVVETTPTVTGLAQQGYTPLQPSADDSLKAYAAYCVAINRAVATDPQKLESWVAGCTTKSEGRADANEFKVGADKAKTIAAWCASPRSIPLRPTSFEVQAVSNALAEYVDHPDWGVDEVCYEPGQARALEAKAQPEVAAIAAAGAVAFGAAFQQQLIEAVSGYLIKRAKAEALNWAGDRMGIEICKADADGELLLPNVCAVVFGGDDKSTAPGISWSVLRQAGIEDLRQLPPRLVGFIDRLSVTQNLSADQREVVLTTAFTLGAAWNVGEAIAAGDKVLESVAGLASYAKPYQEKIKIAQLVYLAAAIAEEARERIYQGVKEGVTWNPSATEIDLMVSLVLERGGINEDLANFLKGANPEWRLRNEDVQQLIADLTELAALAKRGEASGVDDELEHKILAAVTKVFSTSAKITRAYLKLDPDAPVTCDVSKPKVDACSVVALEGVGFVMGMTGAVIKHEYGAAFAEFMAFYRRTVDSETLPPWFNSWLPFITDLAGAKDVETMQGVLESIAAPVGSYTVKRGSIFADLRVRCEGDTTCKKRKKTEEDKEEDKEEKKKIKNSVKAAGGRNLHVMINAYVGVQGGAELLLSDGGLAGHAGPTASIGPELSVGLGKSGSFGIYLPVLDVGMLGDFRVGGNGEGSDLSGAETVEATPNVGFAQVFAPGLYMVFGLGKTPLALALGAQIAPALRTTTSTDDTLPSQKFSTLRFGGFLAIDIPVFIFR